MSFVADIPGLMKALPMVWASVTNSEACDETRILVHVVDVSEESGRDPLEDYRTIRRELSYTIPIFR